MTFASRSLLALAAAVPLASALDVADADFKLGLKMQLQVRAEKGWAEGTDNNRYDTATGSANSEPDDMEFYIRRARIGFAGTYKDVYRFAYIIRNDNQDKAGSATSTTNRMPETHVAYLARDFKGDKGTQQIRAGLDYAFFNGASLNSAGWSPVVAARATEQAAMVAPRGVGVGYKFIGSKVIVGVDIQNNSATASTSTVPNTGDSSNLTANGVTDNGEGLFYGSRVEYIAFDDAEKPHMKPQESFLGAAGKGVLVTVDLGVNQNDNINADDTVTTTACGAEVFFHMDALTAVAEYRYAHAATKTATASANSDVDRKIWLVQAAWAMPSDNYILEPGLRFTRIDLNDDTEESTGYGSGEYGTSGYQWDLGMTMYLNKNANKVAVGYQHWRSEGGGSPAANPGDNKANIVRAQWSFAF